MRVVPLEKFIIMLPTNVIIIGHVLMEALSVMLHFRARKTIQLSTLALVLPIDLSTTRKNSDAKNVLKKIHYITQPLVSAQSAQIIPHGKPQSKNAFMNARKVNIMKKHLNRALKMKKKIRMKEEEKLEVGIQLVQVKKIKMAIRMRRV